LAAGSILGVVMMGNATAYDRDQIAALLATRPAATTKTSYPSPTREADRLGNLTIEDVAQLAGVSVSSARNYFSRPELLSAPTHARIKAAIAQTGYRPAAASPA
jgi:Bacterial regulatory proteins, lacI family